MSAGQQEAAADGVIDRHEFSDLAAAASECAVASGAPPIEIEWNDGFDSRTQNFGTEISDKDYETLLNASQECWDEHVGVVEMMMALDLAPTQSEQFEIDRRVVVCLADAGVTADDWPATEKAIDPSLEADCVDEAGG